MVLKPNPNYQSDQTANMQYPPASSPPQGPPYGENNQQHNQNQWPGYPPPNNAPYPVQSPPFPSAPNPASRGESSSYYGNAQAGDNTYPQNQPSASYLPQSYPYGNSYNQPQPYSQNNQYNPHQQYPPPAEGAYGASAPPVGPNPGSPPPQPQQPYGHPPPSYEQHKTHSPYPQQQGADQSGVVPQTEEERGLMGALAGGVAGGYAGHKMHHGIIGTLGGAYAGHKLEDKWKDHHNKPAPPPAQQPIQAQIQAPIQHHSGPPMLGNFSLSSNRINLDRDYDLIAECTVVNGEHRMSSISLNQVLTNEDGHFKWVGAGGNFGGSARNVHLIDGGKVLEAELCRCDGSWNHDRICLDERIGNEDGDLRLV
jgi:hypothetical protein